MNARQKKKVLKYKIIPKLLDGDTLVIYSNECYAQLMPKLRMLREIIPEDCNLVALRRGEDIKKIRE